MEKAGPVGPPFLFDKVSLSCCLTTIVQQSSFEFFLYTVFSFNSVRIFPVIFILLSLLYFGQTILGLCRKWEMKKIFTRSIDRMKIW